MTEVALPDGFTAVDFESYYDSEYSLKKLSTWSYVYHEKFDAYLAAIYRPDLTLVDHPAKIDWMQISGRPLGYHNASFDGLVLRRLIELGVIPPEFKIGPEYDTADLAVYMHAPRNLAGAARELLGVKVSKHVREAMSGRTSRDLLFPEDRAALLDYAVSDARLCYQLAEKHLRDWPINEREISRLNREAGWRGIPAERAEVATAKDLLATKVYDAAYLIPWTHGAEPDKPLSDKAFRREARRCNLQAPASLAKDDPEAEEWFEEHGDDYPWIQAVRDFRQVNSLHGKVCTLHSELRADSTFPYQCKYFGAHTGRFSGGSGHDTGRKINVQNPYNKELFGVNFRKLWKAPRGFVWGIFDYSQIEARLTLWQAGDTATLRRVSQGVSVYQAHAERTMNWDPSLDLQKTDESKYKYAKARVLGLGFGCGDKKFKKFAKTMVGLVLTPEQATREVANFREANPGIVNLWREHQLALNFSVNHGDKEHVIELPSGRCLYYFNPTRIVTVDQETKEQRNEIVCAFTRGEDPVRRAYGGLLLENATQAIARDVLRDAWVELARNSKHLPLFTLHDEFPFLLPENEAEDIGKEVVRIATTSSPWLRGCPLAMKVDFSPFYK